MEKSVTNLAQVIHNSFTWCGDVHERQVVTNTIFEFTNMLEFSEEEVKEAFQQAQGMDAETDDFIEDLFDCIATE